MRIGICTAINNGIGLATEYKLLRGYLEELGHEVFGLQYDEPFPEGTPSLELIISIETVARHLLQYAPVNFLIPNPEWTKRHELDLIRKWYSKILCKTHEAHRLFSTLFPERTHYVGFLARDQFDPSIPRQRKFLHIGGNGSFRGTQAVLDAWKWMKNGLRVEAPLTIVSKALKERPEIPGVTYFERVTDEEVRHLQNSHRFHLYPSGTEGFGHAIHEAMSVNASILTTAAPPMDEWKSLHKIPANGKTQYNLADVYEVSAIDIHVAAKEMLELDKLGITEEDSREEFLRGNKEFKALFAQHLEGTGPRRISPISEHVEGTMRIAFLGNFAAAESTENMIRWALETGLGHDVEAIQENTATLKQLELAESRNDVFLWVRTPGWLQINDEVMEAWIKTTLMKTASIHLDKFWGIPEREALIGKIPFWKTDVVFTADGSMQEQFAAAGVNHRWMKPAVSEVYIHPGSPKEEYRCDVGFVGARNYHGEYPFREQLVSFLEKHYGKRFKHVSGVRGHELNDVYASMKVVVGDCIFAGTPNYWSDRLPETVGRHGFLLHPQVDGLEIPVPVYRPQDLDDLREQIDNWLCEEKQRREFVKAGVYHVRKHDTWTVRMKELLEQVGA